MFFDDDMLDPPIRPPNIHEDLNAYPVGGFSPTHLKDMPVKLNHFRKVRGANQNVSIHHLVENS